MHSKVYAINGQGDVTGLQSGVLVLPWQYGTCTPHTHASLYIRECLPSNSFYNQAHVCAYMYMLCARILFLFVNCLFIVQRLRLLRRFS